MRPTLEPGDTVFVGKWSSKPPARGELILYSPDEVEKRNYIKRVIAVGGDSVEIHQGKLIINDRVMEQKFTGAGCGTEVLYGGQEHAVCLEPPAMSDVAKQVVPPGSVYVLGDLRSAQQIMLADVGKSWGVVPVSAVKGRVLCIWLSIEPGSNGLFPKIRFDRMFEGVR
jgi:signal peptidase I